MIFFTNKNFHADGSSRHKSDYRRFLARNPFDSPLTLGLFYREKMRAIHYIAPDEPLHEILEVGGGRGGLTSLLYPKAFVTNIDLEAGFASAPSNHHPKVRFLCGDATNLPFPDGAFDAVTMFDLLEHVPDDGSAVREALRVLRPGGLLLISSPNDRWRFPFYRTLKPICFSEEEMFAEWGHVRRGYSLNKLQALIGLPWEKTASFINPVTVIAHDFAFSRIPRLVRKGICTVLLPATWIGYCLHKPNSSGTEIASAWRKPVAAE